MKSVVRAILALFLVTICASVATCAPPKKAPAKRVVLGTKQLSGDQAQLGVTYTLGKNGPINVTLNSAEYTVEPVKIGNGVITPNADQKLLVLHYTLHNPNPGDFGIGWGTININAVDADDTNWRYQTAIAMEDTGKLCNMRLKPAQKTKAYAVVIVPAKGEIPKIIFEARDRLVLRYDLRGKVKRLSASIADPADPTGATALVTVPAQMSAYYPMRELHGKIDSVAFSDSPIKGKAAKTGQRYLIITGAVKNNLLSPRSFIWSTFKPRLIDVDGGEVRWMSDDLYYTSRDDTIRGDVNPGQELQFRYVFRVPQNVGLKAFSFSQGSGRAYEYDLSQVK